MSEVYWLSQAFDMMKRYVACVQAAFADPHLVRFEMTTNFGCALNAESIIDCLSQKKFYAIPSYQRAYKWDRPAFFQKSAVITMTALRSSSPA